MFYERRWDDFTVHGEDNDWRGHRLENKSFVTFNQWDLKWFEDSEMLNPASIGNDINTFSPK